MQVYEGSAELAGACRGCILTVGNFDGLHLGHRALLEAVLQRAEVLGVPSVVYTFDPHPRRVLSPGEAQPQLMQWDQLVAGLEQLGVSGVIRERFTPAFAALSPERFAHDVVSARIAPAELYVGRDFHFGRGRSGSGEMLGALAPDLGIRVEIISQVELDGMDVSSTRIRRAVAEGDVAAAGRALGSPYEIWGTVVEGNRRGRDLGFPTANLQTDNELVPGHGVYLTRARLFEAARPGPRILDAVTNVGTRPTFEPGRVLVETHLIDFHGDVYGERMAVAFHERLRTERRFSGPDELREQIARDVAIAREQHRQLRL